MAVIHPQWDSLFQAWAGLYGFQGAVLYAERGRVVHTGGYGLADQRTGAPVTRHTRFQLASVSKPLTAALILSLCASGHLALDTPVVRYIPEFPYPALSVRHLLQHRSGLWRYPAVAEAAPAPAPRLSQQEVLRLFCEARPEPWYPAGAKFEYCNTNYVLLAALAERVTGIDFASLMEQRVFGPAGMQGAGLCSYPERQHAGQVAEGYVRRRKGLIPAEGDWLDDAFGDKGVYAAPLDLYRFTQALEAGLLLPPALAQAMHARDSVAQASGYGLGWRLRDGYPHQPYHFGWWRGYRTCLIRDLAGDRVLIILSNVDDDLLPGMYWEAFDWSESCVIR
ncbi:MAG: serine hydrolase domain-containing protein [Bacteroidia bacterium]|nr:serine hydrolase domain-containing protein [Bacteroidia bacterium]